MTEIIFIVFSAMILLLIGVVSVGFFLLNRDEVDRNEREDRLRMQRFMKKYQRHVNGDPK